MLCVSATNHWLGPGRRWLFGGEVVELAEAGAEGASGRRATGERGRTGPHHRHWRVSIRHGPAAELTLPVHAST